MNASLLLPMRLTVLLSFNQKATTPDGGSSPSLGGETNNLFLTPPRYSEAPAVFSPESRVKL
jgi:hypothetical protein